MFKFDNTHIFTGYLKQLLASFNIPACKIYTQEFAKYRNEHGKEDPRIVESFDTLAYNVVNAKGKSETVSRITSSVPYLKDGNICTYLLKAPDSVQELNKTKATWKQSSSTFYDSEKAIFGLTRTLNSLGSNYDTTTHEYLGDYLRFLRDYHNVNLMSLYNCFNNKIYSNIYYRHKVQVANPNYRSDIDVSDENPAYLDSYKIFDSRDSNYRIYAFPVKLFADYTIAIDSAQGIELFCGLYKTALDTSSRAVDLMTRTYKKINTTFFNQPFIYDKLNVRYWNFDADTKVTEGTIPTLLKSDKITRHEIINREQDLKLFIKVPVSCRSSITVLEGDFRNFNNFKYAPVKHESEDTGVKGRTVWEYKQNHAIINFDKNNNLNESSFMPIGKLQLLAFNTGESYPFADRLVEYLSKSAITPLDEVHDNIKRAQKVMKQNNYFFKIDGLWESKMQKIIYDYLINSGPIEATADGKLVDRRRGYFKRLGKTSKSTLYDVLGYIDKDAEKWYASWQIEECRENGIKKYKAGVQDNIQNVDIYIDNNGKSLWDL